jgi:hypothetical protein
MIKVNLSFLKDLKRLKTLKNAEKRFVTPCHVLSRFVTFCHVLSRFPKAYLAYRDKGWQGATKRFSAFLSVFNRFKAFLIVF